MSNCGFYVLNDGIVFLEEFNIEIIGFDDYLFGQTETDFYHIQSEYFHLIAMHEPVTSKVILDHLSSNTTLRSSFSERLSQREAVKHDEI